MGYVLSNDLADLYDEFLKHERPRVSAQGYTSLEGLTRRMLAWFDAEELDPVRVGILDAVHYQAAISERTRTDGQAISTGAMHNYLKAARRFFDFLVTTGRRASNPFLDLRYPRLPERLSRNVLSEEQMGILLRELARFDELPRWWQRERRYRTHVVAEFLYATGLRIAEAASLVEGDLDLEHRLVHLRSGKGGKARTAFLTLYAAEVMDRYLRTGRAAIMHRHERTVGGRTIFGAAKARVAEVVNGELAALCRSLALPEITTHCFRYSLGTHLLRAGCDMRYIQAILGHESIATTQIYTRVDKDDLRRSLDEHHPRQWRTP